MPDLFPDGLYNFVALGNQHYMAEANGALVAASPSSPWSKPVDNRTWQLSNHGDGTATLRCVGTSNYLAVRERDGLYYLASKEPEFWMIRPSVGSEAFDVVLAETGRCLWMGSFPFMDPPPLFMQGVERFDSVIGVRWVITSAAGDD